MLKMLDGHGVQRSWVRVDLKVGRREEVHLWMGLKKKNVRRPIHIALVLLNSGKAAGQGGAARELPSTNLGSSLFIQLLKRVRHPVGVVEACNILMHNLRSTFLILGISTSTLPRRMKAKCKAQAYLNWMKLHILTPQ